MLRQGVFHFEPARRALGRHPAEVTHSPLRHTRSDSRKLLVQQSKERILVAMSGGVDSSVAAAELCASGYEVVGVTLHLWDYPDDGSVQGRCCAPEDIHDARRVCDSLGIAHYAFDRRELFEQTVVTPFVEAYLDGVTPSPCVRCNRGVKIRELLAIADRLGARCIATGHYARLRERDGRLELLRARDLNKDQSYFLHMLAPEVLRRLKFPLGEMTKQQVRESAHRWSLPGADKGESQELCFIPTGRYDTFVEQRAPERVRPGPILNPQGQEVGTHAGVHRFTVGQRRNLGVALGERAYVVGLDSSTATVRLGERSQLLSAGAQLDEVVLAPDVEVPVQCQVVVRYRGRLQGACVEATAGGLRVRFTEPVPAVVPGQYAVLYQGERVLGGGRIAAALPPSVPEPMDTLPAEHP